MRSSADDVSTVPMSNHKVTCRCNSPEGETNSSRRSDDVPHCGAEGFDITKWKILAMLDWSD